MSGDRVEHILDLSTR